MSRRGKKEEKEITREKERKEDKHKERQKKRIQKGCRQKLGNKKMRRDLKIMKKTSK